MKVLISTSSLTALFSWRPLMCAGTTAASPPSTTSTTASPRSRARSSSGRSSCAGPHLNLSLELRLPLTLSFIIRITIFQHFNQAENQSKINLISAQFHPWPSLSNGNCYRFTMPPWISLFDLHGVVDIGGCYHPESKSSQQSNIENWFELDSNKGSNFCAFHFTNRDKCWTLTWPRVYFIQGVHEKE